MTKCFLDVNKKENNFACLSHTSISHCFACCLLLVQSKLVLDVADGSFQASSFELLDDALVGVPELPLCPLPRDPSPVEEDDAVHRAPDGRRLVRHDDVSAHTATVRRRRRRRCRRRCRRAVYRSNEVLDDGGRDGVEASGRLVEHDDLLHLHRRGGCLRRDGPGKGNTLLHPARKLRRVPVLDAKQPDLCEVLRDPFPDFRFLERRVLVQPEANVLLDGE
mmetsp:Transcript_1638/g.3607  ORF Transcript_1638/g.3607 Transcript_1638/m.3607 type:complete len:221 (-) Transcript_1638:785-1447(-)